MSRDVHPQADETRIQEVTNDIYANSTPLHLAASNNHRHCVKVLVETYGAVINARNKHDFTAIHLAAKRGSVDVIKTLTSYNECDITATCYQGCNALHITSFAGHVSCIHELMKLGLDIEAVTANSDRLAPLHLAALMNHKDCVYTLIEYFSASINAKSKTGATPLTCASSAKNIDVVKLLTSCVLSVI